MHGFALEAFGCKQLKRVIRPHHVEGADFRNHIGGNDSHNLVEARLRIDRFRHHFAEPTQQESRTAERGSHGLFPHAANLKFGH